MPDWPMAGRSWQWRVGGARLKPYRSWLTLAQKNSGERSGVLTGASLGNQSDRKIGFSRMKGRWKVINGWCYRLASV